MKVQLLSDGNELEDVKENNLSVKNIFVVTMGAKNRASMYQFAFYDLEEAKKFRDYLDCKKGASSNFSTIHILQVYQFATDLIWKPD